MTDAPRGRGRALAGEFGKFGTVGMTAYAIDVAVFNLGILVLDWPDLGAKCLSTVIAASLAFVGNRYWTWRDRVRSGLRREYGLYFLFNAIGLGISLTCLGVNHLLAAEWPGVFGGPLAANIAANLVGVGLGTLFRFHAYRRWVFQNV
ncbi:GtrA family protein [Phytomonospora sp. NPDC050363]|uniref:GtrA family protein n=1 Tax=Phytomonospora sp. NPDC050363 TaxID=3155642 RepID=UPI0033C79E87